MKKKVSISFIALAAAVMLVLNAVPHHHHHDGVACVVMEHCEKDHPADDDVQHGLSCVAESDYIIPNTDLRIKCSVSSCGNCDHPDHIHFFPIPLLVADALLYLSETVNTRPEYGEYISFYTSAEASRFHGLRAPPFFS
jgi:hypothetical protein